MKTISSITETKVVLSDEGDKRYEYTKILEKEKGKAILLIMLNASGNSNINTMDTTTNLTVNNLAELGYTTNYSLEPVSDHHIKVKFPQYNPG